MTSRTRWCKAAPAPPRLIALVALALITVALICAPVQGQQQQQAPRLRELAGLEAGLPSQHPVKDGAEHPASQSSESSSHAAPDVTASHAKGNSSSSHALNVTNSSSSSDAPVDASQVGASSSSSSSVAMNKTTGRSEGGASHADEADQGNTTTQTSTTAAPLPKDSTTTTTTSTTTTTTTTAVPSTTTTSANKPTTAPTKGFGEDEGSGGLVVFVIFVLILLGLVMYGGRLCPRVCPFRRGTPRGGPSGAPPHGQQLYARLDGEAFRGDDEDYYGMQPSFNPGDVGGAGRRHGHPLKPLRGGNGNHAEVLVEMSGVTGASGGARAASYGSGNGADGFSMVVDHNPSAMDQLFASSTSTSVPAMGTVQSSKNSLKSLRKGRLGRATTSTPAPSQHTSSDAHSSSMPATQPQRQQGDDWGWSDEDK